MAWDNREGGMRQSNYHASENPNLIRYATREAQNNILRFCTDGKRSFAALRYVPREAQNKILRSIGIREIKRAFRAAGSLL